MSSHHFVREGQEPALLILQAIAFRSIEPLLEWSPLIVTTEAALEQVLTWGIKIDVVFVNDDREDPWRAYLRDQAPVKVLSIGTADHLTSALNFLTETRSKAVHICARFTEELQRKLSGCSARIQISVVDDNLHWKLCDGKLFKKWLPEGASLTIKTIHHDQKVDTSGLITRNETWYVVQQGVITIESEAPFWIGESY